MYNQQLETFIAVADAGSSSKAGERLYITSTAEDQSAFEWRRTLADELRCASRPVLSAFCVSDAVIGRFLTEIQAGFFPRLRTEGLSEQRPRM